MNAVHRSMSKDHLYSSVNVGTIHPMSISNKSTIYTYLLGCPRIGAKRELKKATEVSWKDDLPLSIEPCRKSIGTMGMIFVSI